jgi:hypothetical protein
MRLPGVPRTLRKIAVAVAVGALTYFVTDLTEQPRIWSLTMTVLIGSITFVVQFLVDVEARLTAVTERTEQSLRQQAEQAARLQESVRQEIAKIGEATELYGYLQSSAVEPRTVTSLARYAARIDPAVHPLIRHLAEAELVRAAQSLRDLGTAGQLSYEGEDRDWLLALAESATEEIAATSHVYPDEFDFGFWSSELGQRYLDAQVRATRRGVRVRRTFVLTAGVQADRSDLRRLLRQQQAARIEVRVWEPGRNPVPDIVLFDRTVSYEIAPQPQIDGEGPHRLRTTLELRLDRVAEHVQWYERMWQRAQPPPVDPS